MKNTRFFAFCLGCGLMIGVGVNAFAAFDRVCSDGIECQQW